MNKKVTMILSIIFIPITWGILFSKIFNLHYVDAKYVFIWIFIIIVSLISIFKTEKFAVNALNNIEMKMIKILWIIMLPLAVFLIIGSLGELELEKKYCDNLKFEWRWQYSSINRYSCDWQYFISYIWSLRTDCSYNLFVKKWTYSIYDYEKIKCEYNNSDLNNFYIELDNETREKLFKNFEYINIWDSWDKVKKVIDFLTIKHVINGKQIWDFRWYIREIYLKKLNKNLVNEKHDESIYMIFDINDNLIEKSIIWWEL